jgi:hypothetical protein
MANVEDRMETRVRIAGQDSERLTGNMVYASFVHTVTRPIDGIPDPHYHIHTYVFNATFDPEEERWKAGEFGGLKRDAPFFEAAFNSRLAEKLMKAGYGIRRSDRDFEMASVRRELIEKFSKRTQVIEQLAREKYTVLEAEARALVKATGMEFADAFAEVKSRLGAESRESKSATTLSPEEQLANWRSQMTPEERACSSPEAVKAAASENLLEAGEAKELALDHLFESVSVVQELHAAAMLLRRGIGRVSVGEALRFASSDPRLLRAGDNLLTTIPAPSRLQ